MDKHPVLNIDPEKEYWVSYLAPHQSKSGLYEYSEEGYKLLGKDLSEKQVYEVAFIEKHISKIKKLQQYYAKAPVTPKEESKVDAVEFAEWIAINEEWTWYPKRQKWYDTNNFITTTELYELFKQTKP